MDKKNFRIIIFLLIFISVFFSCKKDGKNSAELTADNFSLLTEDNYSSEQRVVINKIRNKRSQFETYCGYYFYPLSFIDFRIIKLSIKNCFFLLQEIMVDNQELTVVDEIVLDYEREPNKFGSIIEKEGHYTWNYIYFWSEKLNEIRYSNPSEEIGFNRNSIVIDCNTALFIKNRNDVLKIINSLNIETQRKFTGKYLFQQYDIYRAEYGSTSLFSIYDDEINKDDFRDFLYKPPSDEFYVEINDDGYLFAYYLVTTNDDRQFFVSLIINEDRHKESYNDNLLIYLSDEKKYFLISDINRKIYNENYAKRNISYYFEDDNTIIVKIIEDLEGEDISLVIEGSDGEDEICTIYEIEYKIIFKKVN
jgi:hypothetical protein